MTVKTIVHTVDTSEHKVWHRHDVHVLGRKPYMITSNLWKWLGIMSYGIISKRTHYGADKDRLIFKAVLVSGLPPSELFQSLGLHLARLFHFIKYLTRVHIVGETKSYGSTSDGSRECLKVDKRKDVIGDIDHSGGLWKYDVQLWVHLSAAMLQILDRSSCVEWWQTTFQSVTSARPFFRNIRHLERCIMTYVGIRIGITSRFDYLNEFWYITQTLQDTSCRNIYSHFSAKIHSDRWLEYEMSTGTQSQGPHVVRTTASAPQTPYLGRLFFHVGTAAVMASGFQAMQSATTFGEFVEPQVSRIVWVCKIAFCWFLFKYGGGLSSSNRGWMNVRVLDWLLIF